MSGLGKGITTSSLAKILQRSGLTVTCMKVDPYINFDAGTMNPIAHGEVFVTDDGGECDMDIGNYERFLNKDLSKENNITTGQVYNAVIEDERKGKYLGKCVQIIPHVTDEIKRRIRERHDEERLERRGHRVRRDGGRHREPPVPRGVQADAAEDGLENTLFVHVTLAPEMGAVGEMKTKPTQHSVQELQAHRDPARPHSRQGDEGPPHGGQGEARALHQRPRRQRDIEPGRRRRSTRSPRRSTAEGVLKPLMSHLQIKGKRTDLLDWNEVASRFVRQKNSVTVAMVGKYVTLMDSYVSVNLALSTRRPRTASASTSSG